jgi:hypothetical protein
MTFIAQPKDCTYDVSELREWLIHRCAIDDWRGTTIHILMQ